MGLMTVFGMGTDVAPPLETPGTMDSNVVVILWLHRLGWGQPEDQGNERRDGYEQ